MQIPMSAPDLTEAEIDAVADVLRTSCLSLGPRLVDFEESFAARLGVRHAVGVSSGTAGLHLCIITAGVEEQDLVITTPFSFVASANVILYERAIPIFVDIDDRTLTIDPALVAEATHDLRRGGAAARRWLPPALRDTAQTGRLKAILPVDAFGQPADLDPLIAVAGDHSVPVIEDACEAVGAEYQGRLAGSFVDAAVFAFYPNKQLTTGEGGLIVTNNPDWDALFRSLRNQGRDVFDAWSNHTRLGYNYRLTELSAALGRVQLGRLDTLLTNRDRVAAWYAERLDGLECVDRPYLAPTTSRMSWFVYVVRIRPPAARDAVLAALAEVGIPSRPYFSPIHLQLFYRERFGWQRGDFPRTEAAGEMCLALPFSGLMTEPQVDEICTHLARAVGQSRTRP